MYTETTLFGKHVYISIPNCLILVPGSVKKDPGLVSF